MQFRHRKSPRPVLANQSSSGAPPAEASPAPTSPDPPPKRRRSLRFRIFRFATRTVFLVGLLLASAIAVLLLAPLPLGPLDGRLKAVVERATGMPLTYERVRLNLLAGTLTFTAPRLLDPQSGQELLRLTRLTIDAPFNQLVFGEAPYSIENIELSGPVTLRMALERGRPRLLGPKARALELLQANLNRHTRQTAKPSPVALRRVALSPLDLELWDEAPRDEPLSAGLVTATSSTQPRQMLQVRDAELEMRFDDNLQPGLIWLQTPAGTRLSLRPNLAGRSVDYALRIERFSSTRFPWRLPLRLDADQLDLAGTATWAQEGPIAATTDWETSGRLNLAHALFARGPHAQQHAVGDLVLTWHAAKPFEETVLHATQLNLTGRDVNLVSSGTLGLHAPFAYSATFREFFVKGDAAALIAEPFVEQVRLLDPAQARFEVSGEARGEVSTPRPGELLGQVRFQHLDFSTPHLPEPVRDLQGDGALTSGALRLTSVRATYGGLPWELQAAALGRPLRGEFDQFELGWKTSGAGEGLNSTFARLMPRPIRIRGPLATEGRLRLHDPLTRAWSDGLEKGDLEGKLELRGVTLSDSQTTTPLYDLRGTIKFDRDELRAEKMSGTLGSISWQLDGNATGERFFWRNPRVVGSAATGFDLADLPRLGRELADLLPAEPAERLGSSLTMLPKASGNGWIKVSATGPLADPAKLAWDAEVRGEQVKTEVTLSTATIPLEFAQLHARLDARLIEIERAQGRYGELTFDLGARIAPAEGEVRLKTSGALREYQRCVPVVLERFIVDGRIAVDHLTRYKAVKPPPPEMTLADYLAQMRREGAFNPELYSAARFGPWSMQQEGTVQLEDVEFTYYAMPAWLRHVNTTMRYDEKRLWGPEPFAIDGGPHQRNLKVTFETVYPEHRGGSTRMTFHATGEHFALRDWLDGWKFRHTRNFPPDQQSDPNLVPNFVLRGSFDTESGEVLNLEAKPLKGELLIDEYHEQRGRLEWRNLSGGIYGGTFLSTGLRFNRELTMTIKAENMNLPELRAGLLPGGKTGSIYSGIISGDVRLSRRLEQHPSAPLVGDARVKIEKSRFVSNKLLGGLGGVLRLPIFDDISFSQIEGPVEILGDRYSSTGIVLANPIVNLLASGTFGPDKQLDVNVKMQFLHVVGNVPLVGEALGLINKLAGQVLQVKVRGTSDDPVFRPF